MNTGPPEQIYLQCHEDDGSLRDPIRDDVTWCVDQINESDAVYILATPELAGLLERLATWTKADDDWSNSSLKRIRRGIIADCAQARALAASIREALGQETNNEN